MLGARDAADALRQHDVFTETAVVFAEKHFIRWTTELVDSSLADISDVGDAMAKALLAIYDGEEPPAIDATRTVVTDDGEPVSLAELIQDMTQHATAESLRENSILFMRPDVLLDIRAVYGAPGGDDGAAPPVAGCVTRSQGLAAAHLQEHAESLEGAAVGTRDEARARLDRTLKVLVHAMPTTTHCVERSVNTANSVMPKHGPHLALKKRTAKQSSITNTLRPEWQDAWDAFRDSHAYDLGASLRRHTSTSWRRPGQQVRRTAASTFNKSMLLHALKAGVARGEAQTPELLAKVDDFKKKNADYCTSRDAIAKERDDRKRDVAATAKSAAAEQTSGKRTKFGPDERAIHAAAAHAPVPATASGYLNLDATSKEGFGADYTKKVMASELDAVEVAYKKNGKGEPTESMDVLKDHLRRYHNGASRVPRNVRDHSSRDPAASWNV